MAAINASAAATLLEHRPKKNSGSERDSNPQPLRCGAVLSQLSFQSHTRAVANGRIGNKLNNKSLCSLFIINIKTPFLYPANAYNVSKLTFPAMLLCSSSLHFLWHHESIARHVEPSFPPGFSKSRTLHLKQCLKRNKH